MASPEAVSQYAVEPSASTLLGESLVLPAQRPASPEIAESPIDTTVGVPTPGPSAAAGAAPTPAHATPSSARTHLLMPIPLPDGHSVRACTCPVGGDPTWRR